MNDPVPLLFAGAAVGIVLFGIIAHRVGLANTTTAALLVSMSVAPILLTPTLTIHHVGIAGPIPELRTFSLAILIAATALILTFRLRFPIQFLPLVVWIAACVWFIWPMTPMRWAGVMQITFALLSWGIASTLARADTHKFRADHWIAITVAAIVTAHTAVALLQFLGIDVVALSAADASILGNRVNGLANHPNNLGKILLLLIVLVLPSTRSPEAVTRRIAFYAVYLSFIPLILAQGRANLAAAVVLLIAWYLLLPRGESLGRRTMGLLGVALAGVASAGFVLARFDEDPTGGVRGSISDFATVQIAMRPWFGTGPNAYVAEASPYTGSFIPVHNSFLLAAAELGVVGAILLFGPLAILIMRSWTRRNASGVVGDAARSLVSSAIPLMLVASTGWGMLGTSVFSLWFFVFGYLSAKAVARPTQPLGRATLSSTGTQSSVRAPSIVQSRSPQLLA